MGSIRQYIKRGNVARDRKRGSVHSEENEEKYGRCSSFLTHLPRYLDRGPVVSWGYPPPHLVT